jgi:hypothetical protein
MGIRGDTCSMVGKKSALELPGTLKTVKTTTGDGVRPFPFFGHGIPSEGADCHVWAFRFAKAPTAKARTKIVGILLQALNGGTFEQSEAFPWRWHRAWLVATAVEAEPSPDAGAEWRVQAMVLLDEALLELHAKAPLLEALADPATDPTDSDWDTWSRGMGAPSAEGLELLKDGGVVDAAVENLRLREPPVAVQADGTLKVVELDKQLWPRSPKMLPVLAKRFAMYEAIESRCDRLCSVTDTTVGQVLWCMTDSWLEHEISLADGDGFHAMPAPRMDPQNYERGLVYASADGWLLVCDRELVIELHPRTGARRVLWAEERNCNGGGPREAVRAGGRVVVSTEDGVFLLAANKLHALPVAFWEHGGFKHLVPTPCGRGVVVFTFERCDDPPDIAVLAIRGDRLQWVASRVVKAALSAPRLVGNRVVAKQGRAWREVTGVSISDAPEGPQTRDGIESDARARLGAGKPALVPVDEVDPTAGGREVDGKRLVAGCKSGRFEVYLLDELNRHSLVLAEEGQPKRTFDFPHMTYPAFLDLAPSGTKVLVSGPRGRGFVPSELVLATAEIRPCDWWHAHVALLSYRTDGTILCAYNLMVVDTQGQLLATTPIPRAGDVRDMVVDRNRRTALLRYSDGTAMAVRMDDDGRIIPHESLCSGVARIFASDEHLFAFVDGVLCKFVFPPGA